MPSKQTRTASRRALLLRSLLLAGSPEEALRVWLMEHRPAAQLAFLAGPGGLPGRALKCQADDWSPITLPPVPISPTSTLTPTQSSAPTQKSVPAQNTVTAPEQNLVPSPATSEGPRVSSRSLETGREDAFTDLLHSLGMISAASIPLEPAVAGTLVLASAQESLDRGELDRLQAEAGSLGAAIASVHARNTGVEQARQAGRELANLFDLNQQLGHASSESEIAAACARSLQELTDPSAGGVLVLLGPGESPAIARWPSGVLGDQLAERLTRRSGAIRPARVADAARPGHGTRGPLVWWSPDESGSSFPRVVIELGWREAVPDHAARVVEGVRSSVQLAVDRMAATRHHEREQLQQIFEGLPLGVILRGEEGQVRSMNRTARGLLEASQTELDPAAPVLDTLGELQLDDCIEQAHRTGAFSTELPASDERTIELRIVPARANSSTREALLMLEDVTERKRQREQLAMSEQLALLGGAISGVVHEINNPLATVIGFSEMLRTRPTNPAAERWSTVIHDQAKRCQKTIRSMLFLVPSRQREWERISLQILAEQALSLIEYPCRSKGIATSLSVDPNTPAIVGETDGLARGIANLLTNAMHALESHDGAREIELKIGPLDDGHVRIEVRDTGPGVPSEIQERIFTPFFTTKPRGKGSGLGLSLLKETVRAHKGRLAVDSVPGQGARFAIELPIGSEHPEVCQPPATDTPPDLSGLSVLIVDDEPDFAAMLAETLETFGARTDAATDGQAAMEWLAANRPDVIVSDLQMPRLNGDQLAAQLDDDLRERLIFITGDFMPQENDGLSRHKGHLCLSKPFEVARAVQLIHDVGRGSAGQTAHEDDAR